MPKYYFDKKNKCFVIEDYNKAYPFSNFLPAISGVWGVPLWSFYVNRAQGIVSFGIQDKDHAILEFFPANKAYQLVSTLGFRTFLKIDGEFFYEPFQLNSRFSKQTMVITSYDFTLQEENAKLGLQFLVNYFTLPNMPFPALVRILKIKNISSKKLSFSFLDGVPRILPFSSKDLFVKHLSRTLEAWMKAKIEKIKGKDIAFFNLVVDPQDVAVTSLIKGANFAFSLYGGKHVSDKSGYIIHPEDVFSYDTSFLRPVRFLERGFISRFNKKHLAGKTPCYFVFSQVALLPKEEFVLYTLIGGVFDLDVLKKNVQAITPTFLEKKREENKNIIESIKNNALCISSFAEFDEYLRCCYLDNILRGGYPYRIGKKSIYYVFSRKHGDLERDYNKFKLLPSYFSEGETNYRDVNQNRRMDLFFSPQLMYRNIVYFMNLLRMDGYNPLRVQGEKIYFDDEKDIKRIFKTNGINPSSEIIKFAKQGFYLGELIYFLENKGKLIKSEGLLEDILLCGKRIPVAEFGEGFWIDHWRYNLDLIESFLYFYPDKKKELFYDVEFMFWDDHVKVKDRRKRIRIEKDKIYQAESLEVIEEKKELLEKRPSLLKNFVCTKLGKGKIYKTNLVEKMLNLILNKISTLDFEGIGIEMEADKPGWCDSLNGLPALFGSSVCETLETIRAINILTDAIEFLKNVGIKSVKLCKELMIFFKKMEHLLEEYCKFKKKNSDIYWYDRANSFKEEFREKIFWGVEGTKCDLKLERIKNFLEKVRYKLDKGLSKAKDKSGLYYTYFIYEIKKYKVIEGRMIPMKVVRKPLPLFLEAPVSVLRVYKEKNLPNKVRKSSLYDKKLKMFRLNADLRNTPLEIGRSRIFPRGWLENESIWLHMEYKYLLELLKRGFVDEFYKNFFSCLVCFLPPEIYGRSILENSSFIVSSVHKDKSLWGKGFVARLSGATAELMNIWIVMCLGVSPFYLGEDGNLYIKFSPLLKADLFTKKSTDLDFDGEKIHLPPNTFAFKIFSKTLVVYHNSKRKDTFSKDIKIVKIEIHKEDRKIVVDGDTILPPLSYQLREAKFRRIDVYFS